MALWLDRSVRVKGLAVLTVPTLALVGSVLIHNATATEARRTAERVEHTLVVQRQADLLLELVTQVDSRVRAYAITRDPSELEPSRAAALRVPPALALLDRLVADNPAHTDRMADLRSLVDRRLEVATSRREAAEAGLPDDDDAYLEAADLGAQIRQVVSGIRAEEDRLLARRRADAERAEESLSRAWIFVVLVGVGGGALAAVMFTRGIARRLDHLAADAEKLAGDEPISAGPAGRDEIGRVGEALVETSRLLAERRYHEHRAMRQAQDASRAKTDFLSRMSHELRTPLNAVLGFAQLLELGDLDPDERESVDHIRGAGQHLLTLINEILDLSRIEAGQLSLSPEAVDVREAISDAVTLMRPHAEQSGITLTAELDGCGETAHVRADRQRLKQVLLNLISNAVKYNRPHGAVTVACSRPDDRTLRITVTDTGPGISGDNLELLFEPFERLGADQTTTEGTGIGLALSRELAHLMGGELAVESRVGQGSTFWLQLPLTTPPLPDGAVPPIEATSAEPADTLAGEEGAPAARLTVLQIEDNDVNAQLVQQVLDNAGVDTTVLTTTLGRAGIEIARQNQPDLILLDLHLPDLAGQEVLHILRGDRTTAGIPVVVVSADATPGTVRRTLDQGAADFLTKPLDIHQLLRIVRRIAAPEPVGVADEDARF